MVNFDNIKKCEIKDTGIKKLMVSIPVDRCTKKLIRPIVQNKATQEIIPKVACESTNVMFEIY